MINTEGKTTRVLYGDRIGQEGELRIGCCAVVFDSSRQKILLTRRADNGLWCLPGGAMEPGESVEECCKREVWEETGLQIETTRLVAVYSNRDQLVVYKDGTKVQFAILSFEGVVSGGVLGLSNETTDAGFFSLAEIDNLEFHGRHKDRILDALKDLPTPLVH